MAKQIILSEISLDELHQLIRKAVRSEIASLESKKAEDTTDEVRNKYLTIDELCEVLNTTKTSIYRWRKRGLLPAKRIGHRIYFKLSEVEDALQGKYKK